MMFYTEYDAPGGALFASCVLADSEAAAQDIIAKRGIGERVVGFPVINALPAISFASREDMMQELVFTAWVAVKSGVQSADQVLGPRGWMFEATALFANPTDAAITALNLLLVSVNETRHALGMPRIQRMK